MRYFTSAENPGSTLARISLEDRRACDRLAPEGWVESLGLMSIVMTDDNLRHEEINEASAIQIAGTLAPDVHFFAVAVA